MFALALPQGLWQTGGTAGWVVMGCWPPVRARWCCAMPAPPGSASRSRGHCGLWHRGHPGRHTPSGTSSPALGAPQHPKLPCLARAVPGCNRSSGSSDAFAVSPGGSLEKSSVLGSRIPEPRKTAAPLEALSRRLTR